jgi:hypothetical protein
VFCRGFGAQTFKEAVARFSRKRLLRDGKRNQRQLSQNIRKPAAALPARIEMLLHRSRFSGRE